MYTSEIDDYLNSIDNTFNSMKEFERFKEKCPQIVRLKEDFAVQDDTRYIFTTSENISWTIFICK